MIFAQDFGTGWNHGMATGSLASITSVYDELAGKGDFLANWVQSRKHSGWFLDITDVQTQQSFAEVVQFVESVPKYTRPHKDLFLKKADPWLIAKARVQSLVIITHESFSANTTKVKIPNVCQNFNIECNDTFQALRQLAASFSWVT